MGWLVRDHPLVAVESGQERARRYVRVVDVRVLLFLVLSRPAWIRFEAVTMCSVGRAAVNVGTALVQSVRETVAGRSPTSLEVSRAWTL